MNKKKTICIICIIILLIIILLLGIKIYFINKSNEIYGDWIDDSDFLYDKAIDYLKKESNEDIQAQEKDDYQIFYNYHGFGIKEKNNKKYVYMFILKESLYEKHDKLRSDGRSSMLYKFTFENNEVVSYEVPKDGQDYTYSVKEMFPDDIEDEALKFGEGKLKYNQEIDEHYSYLESTAVFYEDYDENLIVVFGFYGGNKTKAEANTIKGKCIDGYGDIYEFQIPCNENQELLVDVDNINNSIILKYKGNKLDSISEEDLREIENNLYNVNYSTEKIPNKNTELYFVKVALKNNDENSNINLSYKNNEFIDLIVNTSEYRTRNMSTASKNILNILTQYGLSV